MIGNGPLTVRVLVGIDNGADNDDVPLPLPLFVLLLLVPLLLVLLLLELAVERRLRFGSS